jgi:hypothetical protein
LNASTLPVYDVYVRWVRKRTSDAELEERWRGVLLYPVWEDLLPPSTTPLYRPFSDHNEVAEGNLYYGLGHMAVQMTFRDSSGATWLRHVDGLLEQAPRDAINREPAGWELLPMADPRELLGELF